MEQELIKFDLPIVRFDPDNWTVTGQATVEALDAYGTVFDYEASKKAFQSWRGNIREMHDPKKAVGRSIEVEYDDDNKAIYVTTRVSKGARDTWEKVQDGTLTGYSVGAKASKEDWGTVERNGQSVPLLKNYTLVELSLVDNPATPGCNVSIVRADGFVNGEVVDEDEVEEERVEEATDVRVGAKVSHATQSDLHSLRDSSLMQAQKAMGICGCDECQIGAKALDPDGDGDLDIMESTDYLDDGDYRNIEPTIERALQPTIKRFNAIIADTISQFNKKQTPQSIDTSKIEERLLKIEQSSAAVTEVRSLVSALGTALDEVRAIAKRIENQPVQGGPMLGGATEKYLATQSRSNQPQMSDTEVIKRASELGLFADQQSQLNAAAAMIKSQRGY